MFASLFAVCTQKVEIRTAVVAFPSVIDLRTSPVNRCKLPGKWVLTRPGQVQVFWLIESEDRLLLR